VAIFRDFFPKLLIFKTFLDSWLIFLSAGTEFPLASLALNWLKSFHHQFFLGEKIMKKVLACAVVAASTLAAPAFAWEGKVKACYDKVWVGPKYKVTKELVMAGHTEWEHRNGQMVKVWYPSVYKENRTMTKKGHYVAVKAPCRVAK
jgi:hypothetical protein